MFIDKNGQMLVDGIEGHMSPLHIGGLNIDYAIAEYIQQDIKERDTVGTPPAGSSVSGHIYEDALVTKQYLFMKGIKKAKVILSKPCEEESIFSHGAPIGIFYELFVQRMLTHSEISEAIGTTGNTGIAKQILDYISAELSKPLNTELTSNFELAKSDPVYDYGFVVLSGGLSDTFSLREYIESNLRKKFPDVRVLDLRTENDSDDEFSILPNESAAYAASVGGALVALYNEEVKTMLSFSYGTWVNFNGERCLDIFIDRGQILTSKNAFVIKFWFSSTVTGERLYSTVITSKDIAKKSFKGRPLDVKISNDGKHYLRIGEEADAYRNSVKDLFKLQTVAGGDDAVVSAYYNGEQVVKICKEFSTEREYILVTQGIDVDDNGKISPFYGVHPSESSHKLRIYTRDSMSHYYDSVPATSIEIRGPRISAVASQS